MRKFVLIAGLVLASASAQAGESRGLTLASNDDLAATQPAPAPAEATAPLEAPKYVERPSAVDAKASSDQSRADRAAALRAEKRKHHVSTEARVIYELHRHGIYW